MIYFDYTSRAVSTQDKINYPIFPKPDIIAPMRILITGVRGQLGHALEHALQLKHDVSGVDLPECDITQPGEIERLVNARPDLIIHTAAMTDVDGCARDPLAAYRSNALGTQNVALACQRANAAMLYISTNEVFDGTKESPYYEWDARRAINPYGESKLAGEKFVQAFLNRYYIVRTAWLYSPGRNNFVARVLALAKEKGGLAYVDDEISNPTLVADLVNAIAQTGRNATLWRLSSRRRRRRVAVRLGGTHSATWQNESRFDYAREARRFQARIDAAAQRRADQLCRRDGTGNQITSVARGA